MDEIEALLDDWFHAEYAARAISTPAGRPIRQELRAAAYQARANLAHRLATAHEPR